MKQWRNDWRLLVTAPATMVGLRLVIGGIFVYASIDKLAHPDQFAEIIQDYEILPWAVINVAAIWLPCLELIVGLSAIFGVWMKASALVLTGLTTMFIAAIAFALVRGVGLHCGCFSTSASGEEARTWTSLWQEAALLLGCLWLAAAAFRPSSLNASRTSDGLRRWS